MVKRIETFNEVFTRHYRQLVKWCGRRVVPGRFDPEDLVHSAYLRCARLWSAERRSEHCEAGYLYRALRWTIVDAIRRDLRRRAYGDTPQQERECGSAPWGRVVAEEALLSLRGRQQQVCLAVLDGKTDRQICRELHLSSGALAVYLHRARNSLHDLLDVPRRGRNRRVSRPQLRR